MKKLFLLPVLCLLIWKTNWCFCQVLPIKHTRTLSFSTDEGTNMDVDISPDGKTIVFDLLGDLFTVPAVGGQATQLTRGIALNTHPTWSPNGKEIAYVSDWSGSMHINVRSIGGKFHHVLQSATTQIDLGNANPFPVWSTDGHYVAMNDTLLGTISGKIALPVHIKRLLRFSPDGRIAYGIDSGCVFKYNLITNKSTHISSNLKLDTDPGMAISPDGRWLAIITNANGQLSLVVRDFVNNSEKLLVSSLVKQIPDYFKSFQRFAFSPDSRYIYIGYGGKIHRIEARSGDNQIVPFIANVKTDLGPLDYNTFRVTHDPLQVKYCRSASMSPDGKHLVFAALDRIYLMDLPKGKPHVLCSQNFNQFQPEYSPDGKWIAYVSWCDTIGGFLWRVRTDGTELQKLTPIAGQYQHPAWSPDGKTIAVIKGGPSSISDFATGKGLPMLSTMGDMGIGQLQLVSTESNRIIALADSVPLENGLNFSKDGRRVNFEPWISPKWNSNKSLIVSKNIENHELQVQAFGKNAYDFLFRQRSVSPDGHFLVYSMAEDLYLVPVSNPATAAVSNQYNNDKPQTIRFAMGIDPHWEQNGKTLCWNYGNRFFSIDPNKIVEAAKHAIQSGQTAAQTDDAITVTVNPGKAIPVDLIVPKSYAHNTIVLRDARIITITGKVIEHGTIVIKNGRFAAIGNIKNVKIPIAAKIIDLTGNTIIPGLINAHLHQGGPSDICPQQWPEYLSNLAFGVTTMRDPATTIDSYGYTESLETGQMIGPRLFSSGNEVNYRYRGIEINNLNDARSIAQKRKALGGTFIKQYLVVDDAAANTRQKKEWLLKAAEEEGLNMTNEGEYNLLLAFGQLKDGSSGIEHNPNLADAYKDVITLFARTGTYFTPTLTVRPGGFEYFDYKYWRQSDPKLAHFDPDFSDAVKAAIRKPDDTVDKKFLYSAIVDALIRKQGGRVAMGTDCNEPIYAHSELWALKMGGLTNLQALQAATIMGARAIGIQKDVGSIEVGKIADLIVLNKNPLDDIHNSREIKYVMKDGILYNADTLDEIWPVAKKCPEWKLKNDTTSNNQTNKKNLHENSEDDE